MTTAVNDSVEVEEIKFLRVRYSSIVNYSYIVLRAITSLFFSLIVIRRLPPLEYGVFSYIIAFIGFFIPINSLWNYWSFRFYARGKYNLTFTAFTLTIIYSVVGSLTILLLLWLNLGIIMYGFLAGLIFIGQTLYLYFQTLLYAKRPYFVGYINILGEITKASTAYFLVVILKLHVFGALLSLITLFILNNILSALLLTKICSFPHISFNTSDLKILFKNVYIPLIQIINQQIKQSVERLFTALVTGSMLFPAYLGVSYIARNFIVGRNVFTRSLSARLLRSASRIDIEDVFRILVIVSFFVGGGFIVYSRTILSIFRREYLNAQILLIMYTIGAIIDVFVNFFSSISIALEKADLTLHGRELRRTVLFKNPSMIFKANITYISTSIIVFLLLYFKLGISNIVQLLLPFPIAYIVTYTPLLWIFYKRSIEKIKYFIPWREIIASLLGVLSFAFMGIISGYVGFVVTSIYRDFIHILIILSYSLSIYFIILYILSPWFRRVVKIVLANIS
jgi:hypothetical protein